jgi:hypothetical protein
LQAAGATAENITRELAKLPAEDAEDLLELGLDDEGPAIGLFCALNTQWNTAGLAGVRTGLKYEAIKPTAEALQIDASPGVFLDLRIMEDEALKLVSERLAAQ